MSFDLMDFLTSHLGAIISITLLIVGLIRLFGRHSSPVSERKKLDKFRGEAEGKADSAGQRAIADVDAKHSSFFEGRQR